MIDFIYDQLINFWNLLPLLDSNQFEIIKALITVLAAVITGYFAFMTAIAQLKKQFEHKVIHQAWVEFQEKLFSFSEQLSSHGAVIQSLTYTLRQQDNPLVNGGDHRKYLETKSREFSDSYHELMQSYVSFLKSYETYEILFFKLSKMKKGFVESWRTIDVFTQYEFIKLIFPEYYGNTVKVSLSEKETEIKKRFEYISTIDSLLYDFRIEMQNVTLGEILKRKLPSRKPLVQTEILTRNGVKMWKPGLVEKFFEYLSRRSVFKG